MIAPNMATMLAFIFTDADLSANILKSLLKRNIDDTFNAITVDGDTSTNDMVAFFSTGKIKNSYIENVLSIKKLDYEYENQPTIEEIISKIPQAYRHFETKRKQLQFSSDTKIIIKISNSQNILISCEGEGFKLISDKDLVGITNFVKMELDLRLLKWILDGPRFAVWNNAEIGSHIK